MQSVRSGIKMEVAVTLRFEAVYRDLTRIEPDQQQRYSEINAKILVNDDTLRLRTPVYLAS